MLIIYHNISCSYNPQCVRSLLRWSDIYYSSSIFIFENSEFTPQNTITDPLGFEKRHTVKKLY